MTDNNFSTMSWPAPIVAANVPDVLFMPSYDEPNNYAPTSTSRPLADISSTSLDNILSEGMPLDAPKNGLYDLGPAPPSTLPPPLFPIPHCAVQTTYGGFDTRFNSHSLLPVDDAASFSMGTPYDTTGTLSTTDTLSNITNPPPLTLPRVPLLKKKRGQGPAVLPHPGFCANEDAHKDGAFCELVFACCWDQCTDEIHRTHFPDNADGEIQFQKLIFGHLEEHASSGHDLGSGCMWSGCTGNYKLQDYRSMERHLKVHTGAWFHFCVHCPDRATPRACSKPGHNPSSKDREAPQHQEDLQMKKARHQVAQKVVKEKKTRKGRF
ncbi:hypothetical protein DXG01_000610 [Tephrocybe rancida]|nr:hypothetical protein DXG01_000610 [Tephrocybe rancida]